MGIALHKMKKILENYYKVIDAGNLALIKGQTINDDDKVRRAVIMDLICHFKLDFAKVEKEQGIVFKDYFADSFARLEQMHDDGLIELTDNSITVIDKGRLLIRNICMVFDAYLATSKTQFSKTI